MCSDKVLPIPHLKTSNEFKIPYEKSKSICPPCGFYFILFFSSFFFTFFFFFSCTYRKKFFKTREKYFFFGMRAILNCHFRRTVRLELNDFYFSHSSFFRCKKGNPLIFFSSTFRFFCLIRNPCFRIESIKCQWYIR